MQIDIFSDTVCPWCYVGKRRFEAALAERPDLKPSIVWHPFELNPDMADEGMDRDEFFTQRFGSTEKIEAAHVTLRSLGEGLGIPFDFEKCTRMPNTARSHALIFWAQQQGLANAAVEALFKAYFVEGRDTGDHEVLADVAASIGLDRELVAARLESDYDLEAIRAVSRRARDLGLSGVPCFIINRKHAIVGAQEPEIFLDLFVRAEDEESAA
ncbi:DsbA family oxidoreductase [Govanella unica]|uniref:DsbA family oxidoreductase n=1 Tax=Govanella unica TaxID=2975056 RepID=A0A9X3TY11_9PROT|nr:DsbA family oxidoreductase [Govania unica]MDA5194060.1 DsbA family oxidoreductase [Govania unica]